MRILLIAVTCVLTANASTALAQGGRIDADVQVQVQDGQLVTGLGIVVADLATEITIGQRVFGESLQSNFRTSNPGFNSAETGNPILPAGISGLGASTNLEFDIVPFRVGETVSNFFYWDGSDANDISLVSPPSNVTWRLFDRGFNRFEASGQDTIVSGGIIENTGSNGRLHRHLAIAIDGDGSTPSDGVYVSALRARADGFEHSDPFFFVHRTFTTSQDTLVAAVNAIDANYDALIQTELPGDFNEDGSVDIADYTVWRDGLGGDFVLEDYDTWLANFGESFLEQDFTGFGTSGSATAFAAVAVPEPMGALLLLLAVGLPAASGRPLR